MSSIVWRLIMRLSAITIMVLNIFVATKQMPAVSVTRTIASTPSTTRAGSYSLISGTDGCPTSLKWENTCAGFAITPEDHGTALDTQHFCNINRGVKVNSENTGIHRKKIMTQVESKDRYVRKAETTILGEADKALALNNEDTLIFDQEKEQFLWEQSRNRKGFSCLYSK
mgnify:CR=1 FL=1